MPKKKYRKKNDATGMIILGGGLVLLAVAIIIMLSRGGASASAGSSQGLSTIPVSVNYPAPDLSLENINGEVEALDDYLGKVVLVNNWATWCPPCKAEMPTLVEFYNDHADEGFMIVAIEAGEPKEEVMVFVKQFEMPFAVWLDPNNEALYAFKNQSLPNSYVIDRDGTVRLAWTGEINREMLEKYVTPLISE